MKNGFSVLTVSQLNQYVRSLLEGDPALGGVFLKGEISNFTNHYRSGHLYLSLKDENSVIRAVMFRGNAQRLQFEPCNGMRVIVTGRVSIYDREGQYQFYIDDMQPDGIGSLHIAFEQLKEKLRAQGIFDEARKRPLPEYPMRIGVVTSPTGAALQDILNILKRRWPIAKIVLCPVLVQGEGAPAQICLAIEQLNRREACDVMIVGRGGGSLEELWAFNDERVALSIFASGIPVVSAVGHETDFTIADFAADLRAPTPSAAAELVSPDGSVVAGYLSGMRSVMTTVMNRRASELRTRLRDAVTARALKSPMHTVEQQRMRLDYLNSRAVSVQLFRVSKFKADFAGLAGKIDSLSPLRVLTRGYAIPLHADGTVVRDVDNFLPEEEFRLRMNSGMASCRLLNITGLPAPDADTEETSAGGRMNRAEAASEEEQESI